MNVSKWVLTIQSDASAWRCQSDDRKIFCENGTCDQDFFRELNDRLC